METSLQNLANKINIELSEEQIAKFDLYKKLLKEWNENVNLTAITKDDEIILKHFIDSMTSLKYIPENAHVIDVGTGAGFPGLVIKIVKNNTRITLLDSLSKRLLFLDDVIEKCNVKDVETVHGRAEETGKNIMFRERYDIAIARAVANMSTLSELCLPFVKVGGLFIAMKGNNIEELDEAKKAIEILGGEIEKIDNFKLPDSDIERNIIIIRKVRNTPSQYPRKPGMPTNKPIK